MTRNDVKNLSYERLMEEYELIVDDFNFSEVGLLPLTHHHFRVVSEAARVFAKQNKFGSYEIAMNMIFQMGVSHEKGVGITADNA